ncbi:MAG: hypothetical protein WDM90_00290 [Ferruginibacter sp.]
MHKFILISIFSFIFFAGASAQQKNDEESSVQTVQAPVEDNDDKKEAVLYIDTTLEYNHLEVPADSVAEWKNAKSFAYVQYLDSLLKANQNKEKPKEDDRMEEPRRGEINDLFSSAFFQVLLWSIAGCFVLFILYKLFLTEGAFRKRPKLNKTDTPAAEEEIITSETNFEILIRQAVQSGNYRLAVRYQYLQTLHKLSDRNFVSLANDKTNYQYVREITNQNYQNDFAALTLNYEYVWYGEFSIEENIYRRIETSFSQFNNRL